MSVIELTDQEKRTLITLCAAIYHLRVAHNEIEIVPYQVDQLNFNFRTSAETKYQLKLDAYDVMTIETDGIKITYLNQSRLVVLERNSIEV